MIPVTHAVISPERPDVRVTNPPGAFHGPYRFRSQAEYVARILRCLNDVAEIVPAGRNGPWWVRAVAADAGRPCDSRFDPCSPGCRPSAQ